MAIIEELENIQDEIDIDDPGDSDEEISLTPKPGFVIKTRLEKSTISPVRNKGTKFFINLCHEKHVPAPDTDFSPEVIPLILADKWEIPIVCSEEREDKDKKGVKSFVYDCVINDRAFTWVLKDKDLRTVMAQWCINAVEFKSKLELSDEVSFPKLPVKGKVGNIIVKASQLKLPEKNVTTEIDEMAKLILDMKKNENNNDEKETIAQHGQLSPGPGQANSFLLSQPSKKPLIEVIGEADNNTGKDLEVEREIQLNTSIIKLDKPKEYTHAVRVSSADIEDFETVTLDYDNKTHKLLLFIHGQVLEVDISSIAVNTNLKGNFKAFFEKGTKILSIFIG